MVSGSFNPHTDRCGTRGCRLADRKEEGGAVASGIQPARGMIWALHLALPLGGLWLLLARPGIDVLYLHASFHFWLVLIVAAVNVALGVAMSAAAKQRDDGRLFLVSLVFLASAGF